MKNNVLFGFAEVAITPDYPVQTVGFNRMGNLSKEILHKLLAQITVWCSMKERVV